jgi:uncharacterized damage-inducible protein DinB
MLRLTLAQSNTADVLLETYAANSLMNQLLLRKLDVRIWRAEPPGLKEDGIRTIAEIFAHMHNNRLVWLKRSAPHLTCPKPLDPKRCTVRQTITSHWRSAERCQQMLAEALSQRRDRRVSKFSRGSWASDWPAGPTMLAYMFAHEAHHRGQVILLAHQLGYRLPEDTANGIWRWDDLWRELGVSQGPR